MLPDYPRVKKHVANLVFKAVEMRVPQIEPVLGGIPHQRIHEGHNATLTRADASSEDIGLSATRVNIQITTEQMRGTTLVELMQLVTAMAEQLAEAQSKMMFQRLERAVEEVGNSVSAAELGKKEAFLETERRIQREVNAETLELKPVTIVLHPDSIEKFKADFAEWEKDPAFRAERESIQQQKIEEWRAREDRRKLVD